MLSALASQAEQRIIVPRSSAASAGAPVTTQAMVANERTTQQAAPANTQSNTNVSKNGVDLKDPKVMQAISALKARDIEVRAHEQAHVVAGGQYVTSGAHYSYQTGPDGHKYAVGGEVGIDTAAVPKNPEATLSKAQQVFRAAMAPAQPSAQDFSVAQAAQAMMAQAHQALREEQQKAMTSEFHVNTKNTQSNADTKSQQVAKTYQHIDASTNNGSVGGYQDSAHRLGLRIYA